MDVSNVFHDFHGVSGFSRVFQGRFKKTFKVFQRKFQIAWHSSQLPEQKEGLFCLMGVRS